MEKRMYRPFLKEEQPRISQELQRYNPYIHSGQDIQCSTTQPQRNPKLRTHIRTKMVFGEIDPRRHKFWLSVELLRVYVKKNLGATILFVDFANAFDSIHNRKMGQIQFTYGLPKETTAAIMMLYRNTKVKVRSPDGPTNYFNIAAGVLQRDTLAPYLFIICLDYVLRTSIDKMKENGFKPTKERSRKYPAQTITDADSADDIELLANAPKTLHSVERADAGIGLHVNAHKTEYMCFN